MQPIQASPGRRAELGRAAQSCQAELSQCLGQQHAGQKPGADAGWEVAAQEPGQVWGGTDHSKS